MNKYVALALLGSASACVWEQAPHCPENPDAIVLSDNQALRILFQNMYQGFMKGMYQANKDVVSEECFGSWMDGAFDNIGNLATKVQDDFWSVSISEVKDVGSEFIDNIYKNIEVCQFEKVGDDMKGWCLENPGACIFMEGLENRLFDNMFDIAAEGLDLFKLMMVDDTCYSDMEQMAEVYRFSADFGALTASFSGFDYKWDQAIQRKHIKRTSFNNLLDDAMEPYLNKDPFELMFPGLLTLLNQFMEQFNAFMLETQKQAAEFQKALMPKPVPHHHSSYVV